MGMTANIAAYRFTELDDCVRLKTSFLNLGRTLHLKGTIILSQEGINLMISGSQDAIDSFREALEFDSRFAKLDYKVSYSEETPFQRFLVKIKPEIISMRQPNIQPNKKTGRYLAPKTLKQWLDLGKPITLLDTRNTFEIAMGSFEQAIHVNLDHFTNFPQKLAHLQTPKQQTVVTFCTGGIRCEKATAFMLDQGFTDVYQLEGGILRYLEDCGQAHYKGNCFVFDQREALNASLKPHRTQHEG